MSEAFLPPALNDDSSDASRRPLPSRAASRHFLFVTAPFGPFSRRFAGVVRQNRAHCSRILLNGGDLVDWGVRHASAYLDTFADWPAWIEDHMVREGVTDLITHGDGHPYGAAAATVAKTLGIKVHVFEEGYLRPHWITLEQGGVNANSGLPRTADGYANIASDPHFGRPMAMGRITPSAVRHISWYHLANYLLSPLFPRYRNPYRYEPALQCVSHIRRFVRQTATRAATRSCLRQVIDKPGPLFLALLQRPGDSQLVRNSALGTCESFISCVIESFAAHAPPTTRLLIKSHPLDHGLEPHALTIKVAAAQAGVSDRVFFTDVGHLPTLARRAEGVISVNSSAGLAVLELGRPTLALGEAIYDIAGLTHQSSLASFWTAPEAPDRALVEIFRAVVLARTQINGAFSTRRGIELAAPEAARRMLAVSPY
jgi:capsular polysaccharide export protein